MPWPGWVWFIAGGAVATVVVTAVMFWIDYHIQDICRHCGGIMICTECYPVPHHEFQGASMRRGFGPPAESQRVSR